MVRARMMLEGMGYLRGQAGGEPTAAISLSLALRKLGSTPYIMLYCQLQETNMTIEQRRNSAPNSPADCVKFRCRATRPYASKALMQTDFSTIDGDFSGPKQISSLLAGRR